MAVSEKDLKDRIDVINELTGNNFKLSAAYGGYRMECTRIGDVLNSGFISKPKLYELLYAC